MNILDIKNEMLLESGIKLPKGTKAVKMTVHADLDGFFSGLVAYHQLIRQGIPKENIKISFIQYGDEEKDVLNKTETKGKQASVVLDFSALPRKNLFDEIKVITNYKFKDDILEKKFFEYINKAAKGNKENKEGFINFTRKTFEIPEDKNLDDFYNLFKKFDTSKIGKVFNKKNFSVPLVTPDFVSDHHYDDKGKLVKGKSGGINKLNFKSDTEHISVSYAPNIADFSTIKEISKMDSASFTNIIDNFELPKKFKEKGRMERLAILTRTIVEATIKANPKLAIEILKNSNPSLVSVYNTTIKLKDYNRKQLKILNELSSDRPNWNLIDKIRSELPESLKKETSKEKLSKLRPIKTIEQWREYGERGLEKTKTGYLSPKEEKEIKETYEEKIKTIELYLRQSRKHLYDLEKNKAERDKNPEFYERLKEKTKEYTKEIANLKKEMDEKLTKKQGTISKVGNIARQDIRDLKEMPSRFLGPALIIKGERLPFQIRRMPSLIQVALSPDAPKELREKVNLSDIARNILKKIREEHETFSNKWAFDIISDSSGGHKGITTFSSLNVLGLLPKKERERLKELEALNSRAVKVGSSMLKIAKKLNNVEKSKWVELNNLREKKAEAAKKRTEIMNAIEKELYKELWKYKDYKVTKPIEKPEKYKLDEWIEELKELL